jgi:uncharacterized Tic20 family protein
MNENQLPQTTSEERIWAALAHGSILLFGWGVIVPAIVWISQREKSSYVAFHAIQALAYQLLQTIFQMAMGFIAFFSMMAIMFITIPTTGSSDPEQFFLISNLVPFIMIMFMFCIMGLYIIPALVGAVFSIAGRDFRYPLLGKWIQRYLKIGPDGEE